MRTARRAATSAPRTWAAALAQYHRERADEENAFRAARARDARAEMESRRREAEARRAQAAARS